MSEPAVSTALGAWLALRRLERGRVTHADGLFLDDGRPLPGYLTAPLRALLDQGSARADPPRLHLTDAGHAAYEDLCRQRRRWLATDRAVPFGTTARPAGQALCDEPRLSTATECT